MSKKRLREINIDKVENMKKRMDFSYKEVQNLLGVSASQWQRYKACGKVPANRYYAARDALLLATEERARNEREQILELFK
jgi:hypothetical protein